MVALRLEARDEYLHDLGPEQTFNESMYCNIYDPAVKVGGFFRLGNRPNEGVGEMTACVYLPGGKVAFMFQRPTVTDNKTLSGAGMQIAVLDPFVRLRVKYTGAVLVLDDPLEMADPKAAFAHNPTATCELDLDYTSLAPPVGGEPDAPSEHPGEEFARGHYEVLVAGSGMITIGSQRFDISGWGLRDHSWGPRTWQAPWYYRWLTGNAGADFGFMGTRIARRDGGGVRGGFVWEDGSVHPCDSIELHTTWEGSDVHQREVHATLRSGDRAWQVEGRVQSLVPLRNRSRSPDGDLLVTRIAEGLTEWKINGDRRGYGMSEYLDQIVDGTPVGAAE